MGKENTAHSKGVGSVKVIPVIEVVLTVGRGVPEDPVRTVTEYWSLDGQRLSIVDSLSPEILEEFVDNFIKDL